MSASAAGKPKGAPNRAPGRAGTFGSGGSIDSTGLIRFASCLNARIVAPRGPDAAPPLDDFAARHSIFIEFAFRGGRTLRYTSAFETREFSIPVAKAGELKRLYRISENDERGSAVLKRAP